MATAPEITPGTHRHTEHIIYEMAKSIRERDVITYDHSRRVAISAYRLARHLGWTRRNARNAAQSGLVHDLGKTWLKNNVLHKEAPLSSDEREEMKRHCEIGARILQIYAVPDAIIEGVLYHQEMYNGRGYPFGLAGDAIPIGGRLIAVVDVFDALASPRPYKAPMSVEATREYLVSQSGQYFDPGLVNSFVELLDRQPDFELLPRHETLVPHETPEEWDNAPRPYRISKPSEQNPRIQPDQFGAGLLAAFRQVPDLRPRSEGTYPLAALLALLTSAMLSGARCISDVEEWGRRQPPHIMRALGLNDGQPPIPGTLQDVLGVLPLGEYEHALESWAQAMHMNLGTRWNPFPASGLATSSGHPQLPGLHILTKYHMEYGLAPVYKRETPAQILRDQW